MKRILRPFCALVLLVCGLAYLPTPIPCRAQDVTVDGTWLQIPAPEGIQHHSAIHDPLHGRMLIFGGVSGQYRDEVLALELSGPAVLGPVSTAGTPPSARHSHAAIYDPLRERMLVFGGADSLGFRNDVWVLSLSGPTPTWSELTPSGAPPNARVSASAIYDPVRDRLVLFGGFDGSYPPLNDVWALNLSGDPGWVQLLPVISLPPYGRHSHSAIYDPAGDRMIVFGGMTSASENDTWALSLSGTPTWSPIAPAGPKPSPRWDHVAIHDPVRGRMVIHGGYAPSAFPYTADLWALSLTGPPAWSLIDTSEPSPIGRAHHAAIYDPVGDRMVMFGGSSGEWGSRDDGWGLALAGTPTWTELRAATTPPSGRYDHTAVLDPVRNRMVVFGGYDGTFRSYVSAVTLGANPAWGDVATPGLAPDPRAGHEAIYDSPRDRMLVFGGLHRDSLFNYTSLNDVWELSMGTALWSPIVPAGPEPPERERHSVVYDSARDRLLVFGGHTGAGEMLNDVWALSLTGAPTWSLVAPIGTPPPPRFDHSAIFDPVRDRMVVFSGFGEEHLFPWIDDLWELCFTDPPEWIQIPAPWPRPLPRSGHTAVYDPVRDRTVIFGGETVLGWVGDVHALDLAGIPTWSQLAPDGIGPTARASHTAVYDPGGDQMLLFSGSPGTDRVLWSLRWGDLVDVPRPDRVGGFALGPSYPNPARGAVTIPFTIPSPGDASLTIYDLAGRAVRRLLRRPLGAGDHAAHWDGRSDRGARIAPGIYICELRAGTARRTRRLVLVD